MIEDELQLTGGHLAPLIALLRNQNQESLIDHTSIYKVIDKNQDEQSDTETYTAYILINELLDVLETQPNSQLLQEVGIMLQQEISNLDTTVQLRMLDMEQTLLQRAKKAEEIEQSKKDILVYKSRVVRSQVMAKNIRTFMTLARAKQLNFDEVIQPITLPEEQKTVSFTEGILHLCNRSLFEGTSANPALKARVDEIISEKDFLKAA